MPAPAAAVLEALRLDRTAPPPLPSNWAEALAFADRTQLTLLWRSRLAGRLAGSDLPQQVRSRLDRNHAANAERVRRFREAHAEIAARLSAAGVDFVALKGLSHAKAFVPDAYDRVQYDLDYYCPHDSVERARDVLVVMGYQPLGGMEEFPTDHLPAMIRKTGWQWRGDYFDPELPPSVDLHFRFWDAATEGFEAPGVEEFWERRIERELDPVDQVGYAALHALRHLLRGNLRPAHVWEIAWMLEARREDAGFWARWRRLHPAGLRELESIVFAVARAWFGWACRTPEAPPERARAWLDRFAWSPVEGLFRPNKHEVVLNLALAEDAGARRRILGRRLLPAVRLPGPMEAVHVPDHQLTARLRARRWLKTAAFVAARVVHHARVLGPTLWLVARWRGGR